MPAQAKSEKKSRAPNAYALFVKHQLTLPEIRAIKQPRERFKKVAERWHAQKQEKKE